MKNLKRISSQNLKECLRTSSVAPFSAIVSAMIGAWIGAMPHSGAWANTRPDLVSVLKKEIESQRQNPSSFELLTQNWETQYGLKAFQPLIQIASNRFSLDADRYIALMSAAKLGGHGSISALMPFLHDRSWMIRGAALRALSAVGNSQTGESIIPLLRDPALVVRTEAVEAVRILRPRGAAEALIATLEDGDNYRAGKAQWVPQKALLALTTLHASEMISRLKPFLGNPHHSRDATFRKQVQQALNLLEGRDAQETPTTN